MSHYKIKKIVSSLRKMGIVKEADELQKLSLGMAFGRDSWKDRMSEYFTGAFKELLKSEIAKSIGEEKWVEHWVTEYKSLTGHAVTHYFESTTKEKFSRVTATKEVLKFRKSKSSRTFTIAINAVSSDFNMLLNKNKVLSLVNVDDLFNDMEKLFYKQVSSIKKDSEWKDKKNF